MGRARHTRRVSRARFLASFQFIFWVASTKSSSVKPCLCHCSGPVAFKQQKGCGHARKDSRTSRLPHGPQRSYLHMCARFFSFKVLGIKRKLGEGNEKPIRLPKAAKGAPTKMSKTFLEVERNRPPPNPPPRPPACGHHSRPAYVSHRLPCWQQGAMASRWRGTAAPHCPTWCSAASKPAPHGPGPGRS